MTETIYPQRRALEIDEICRHIVAHVHPIKGIPRRKTLVQLARTSRAFSEAALDRLWHTLDGLDPIFHLSEMFHLPQECEVLEEAQANSNLETYTFVRLRGYANRVRTLRIYGRCCDNINVSGYTRLSSAFRHQLLFPNLVTLRTLWDDSSNYECLLNIAPILASPSLHSIAIELWDFQFGNDREDMACTLLQPFVLTSTSLRSLRVVEPRSEPRPNSVLLRMVASFEHLERLELWDLGVSVAQLCELHGRLPCLAELHLNTANDGVPGIASPTLELFPCLDSLTIRCPQSEIMRLIPIIPKTLSFLNMIISSPSDHARDLCSSIEGHFRSGGVLKKLHIFFTDVSRHDLHPTRFSGAIGPLLDIDTLEDVDIHLRGEVIAWQDTDVLAIATAWPRLRALSIFWDANTDRIEDAHTHTLDTIALFARYCPHLRSLQLGHVRLASTQVATSLQLRPHNLRTLVLRHSPIPMTCEDSMGITQFLDHLFPQCSFGPSSSKGLKHVLAIIRALQASRKEDI